MNTPKINIRRETENDYRAVESMVRESFWNVYRPGCTEHYVLRRLRAISQRSRIRRISRPTTRGSLRRRSWCCPGSWASPKRGIEPLDARPPERAD